MKSIPIGIVTVCSLLLFNPNMVHAQRGLNGAYFCLSMHGQPCQTMWPILLRGDGAWKYDKGQGTYQIHGQRITFYGGAYRGPNTWGTAVIGARTLTFDNNPNWVVVWSLDGPHRTIAGTVGPLPGIVSSQMKSFLTATSTPQEMPSSHYTPTHTIHRVLNHNYYRTRVVNGDLESVEWDFNSNGTFSHVTVVAGMYRHAEQGRYMVSNGYLYITSGGVVTTGNVGPSMLFNNGKGGTKQIPIQLIGPGGANGMVLNGVKYEIKNW